MPKPETDTRQIVARLTREGWVNTGGGKHDVYVSERRPDIRIVLPRHRTQSPGVARAVAKLAGWM